jgi:DNA (cytosine-5)-methyltransferase 1
LSQRSNLKLFRKEEKLYELALFAGAGGGILGSHLLGWTTKCAVEIDPYCRSVLLARQRDKILPLFPIWDNIKTFNGNPWKGHIDVITGGFPCQDISSAGKRTGISGNRSSLFFEMLRIIEEVEPAFVFAENSPQLRTRGLGSIIKGLTSLGFVGVQGVLGAGHIGAPHERKRMWILAAHPERATPSLWQKATAHPTLPRCRESGHQRDRFGLAQSLYRGDSEMALQRSNHRSWWSVEPNVGRVVHGLASQMDQVKALGNGQVPRVAATAWTILSSIIKEN